VQPITASNRVSKVKLQLQTDGGVTLKHLFCTRTGQTTATHTLFGPLPSSLLGHSKGEIITGQIEGAGSTLAHFRTNLIHNVIQYCGQIMNGTECVADEIPSPWEQGGVTLTSKRVMEISNDPGSRSKDTIRYGITGHHVMHEHRTLTSSTFVLGSHGFR